MCGKVWAQYCRLVYFTLKETRTAANLTYRVSVTTKNIYEPPTIAFNGSIAPTTTILHQINIQKKVIGWPQARGDFPAPEAPARGALSALPGHWLGNLPMLSAEWPKKSHGVSGYCVRRFGGAFREDPALLITTSTSHFISSLC